jgi:hypothetical protein
MSYGMKRWSLGYFNGVAIGLSICFWPSDPRLGCLFVGFGIILFFVDYLVAKEKIMGQHDAKAVKGEPAVFKATHPRGESEPYRETGLGAGSNEMREDEVAG